MGGWGGGGGGGGQKPSKYYCQKPCETKSCVQSIFWAFGHVKFIWNDIKVIGTPLEISSWAFVGYPVQADLFFICYYCILLYVGSLSNKSQSIKSLHLLMSLGTCSELYLQNCISKPGTPEPEDSCWQKKYFPNIKLFVPVCRIITHMRALHNQCLFLFTNSIILSTENSSSYYKQNL